MIHNLHICWSSGYFIGQVRPEGMKSWRDVTGRCKTAEAALALAVSRTHNPKRARVLFVDSSGWYEPNIVMEAKR